MKNRFWAGIIDLFYFYLAILEGIGAAINRFKNGFLSFLICQARINEPALPEWILKIYYIDEFHRSYMGYIYLMHAHNNPVALAMAQLLIDAANKKT